MRNVVVGSIRNIPVTLRDKQEFVSRYLSDPPHGGMVLHTNEALCEGELLDIELHLQQEAYRVNMKGLILWRRMGAQGLYDVGVGFLSTEAVKREELLGVPQADSAYSERREQRFSITLKVTYETATDFIIDYTRNISTGGLFVSSRNMPALGTDILFKIFPPGESEPIKLQGQVAWHKTGQGFGVRFVDSGDGERKRLDDLVRQASVGSARHPMTNLHYVQSQ